MPLSEDQTQFYKDLRVTDPECDYHNRMKLSDILRHMQEISGEHLYELGLPYERLYGMGQVFLLSKIWLDVKRRPASGETLRWVTEPYAPVGAQFVRCNDVVDADGEIILHSDTLWMLVDPRTRSILRPNSFGAPLPLKKTFDRAGLQRFRVARPEGLEPAGTRTVYYSDLDVNRHMNNAIYADVVCDFLPDDVLEKSEPAGLFLHFQSEAVLHAPLSVSYTRTGDGDWFLAADLPEGKCFEALLKMEKQ